MTPRRGEYGFDAPYVPALMSAGACLLLGGAGFRGLSGDIGGLVSMGLSGAFLLACASSYVYTTRAGKFRAWDDVLDSLNLRGDEQLLDLGCGRGAVLLLGAQKLPRGQATGIDLWQAHDQSGNAESATRANAEREGVSERVSLDTGDMRKLPFAVGSFDVVVSSLALHNIPSAEGRTQAIREALRVVKPGGQLALADFRFTSDYVRDLREAGTTDVVESSLGLRFWYGGPWAATRLVRATKSGRMP